MKSPQTDVTRFITEAPDGSNYMDPKPAEIPPMLARQITGPYPPAPASGSGINPQMLVRPQGDAQSRGSNLANTMPRREDFRRRRWRQMRSARIRLQGRMKFWRRDLVTDSIGDGMEVAQALVGGRGGPSVREPVLHPEPGPVYEEWKRAHDDREQDQQFASAVNLSTRGRRRRRDRRDTVASQGIRGPCRRTRHESARLVERWPKR